MARLESFRDLKVYQRLKELHLEVHRESLEFPKFEMYELGSQVRRSSNAAPAILAEGWGSRHTNIYMEAVNRSLGEVRETQHHIDVARDKQYLTAARFNELDARYDQCGRMLESLYQALNHWRGSVRGGKSVREPRGSYGAETPDWDAVVRVTQAIMDEFP